jgi:DDE_Tnp_1-associated/Transposase DDE domain
MELKKVLERIPDPRGRQGRDYRLWSILGLILVSMLCGRRGMKAAFLLGRSLTRMQKRQLGFMRGHTPCHATLTETLRILDAQAVADILGAVVLADNSDDRHIAIDGKTLRASKDGDGRAEHVLSAFCGGLQTILSHEASRGKGLEIPDALKLLARLDLRDRIVTGDAIFCQRAIAQTVVDAGGDYLLPVKNNQKTLRESIETAFAEPVFPPRNFR